METTLDLRTLAVVLMLISFALSAVMIYVWRSSKTYDGFGWWTAGTTAAAVTFLVSGAIGQSYPIFTATLASAAGTGSLLTAYLGIRRFFGRSMPYRRVFLLWVTCTAIPPVFMFVIPDPIVRITLVSMIVAFITGASALEFRTAGDSESRRVYIVAGLSYGMFSAWMIIRSILNVQIPGLFSSNAGQAWTMAVYIVYNVFWTFNYLILNNLRLREELEKAKSELELQATTDFLTGVPNDRSFFDIGHREFMRAVRFRYPLSVVMMDLDGFKFINDKFGHAQGDLVLKSAVSSCTNKLRSSDTLARLGGDEFAIILAFTTAENARIVAEVLREAVANSDSGSAARVTASFGGAAISDNDSDIKTVLDRADKNLYEAKRLGRNRVIGVASEITISELVEVK
ncbi:MAG TPA: GGDEF domain-containing protein [Pyrinomonadaceae bacterium]|nr:GGDEF domain-containing protein [Pyrinomonadaceae bacterium]